jgi:glycosyltransferase involved in cell wall biosynthesis
MKNCNNKLNVCLFCKHFYPHIGGNETQTMNLALELTRQGINVMVVTARIDKSYPQKEIYNNIKIYRANYLSLIRLVHNVLKIIKKKQYSKYITVSNNENKVSMLRMCLRTFNILIEDYSFMYTSFKIMKYYKNDFDIIHSQILSNYGYMAFYIGRMLKKPVIIKHASLTEMNITLKPGIKKKCDLLRNNAYFVAISSQIERSFIQQGISPGRIFRIFNGIDISDIDSKNNDNSMPNTILYVGNFWQGKIKGLDILIKAMGEVVKHKQEAKLYIAGEGNLTAYIAIAKECGCEKNIEFLNQVKDMDNYYSKCSVFILPSRQEGMSNSTLEAMSYGMPCVVTDVSGSSDQIENSKEGIIVPIEDYQTMAQAICYILDNPEVARTIGRAAKEKICTQFDMKFIVSQIINTYKFLINTCYS